MADGRARPRVDEQRFFIDLGTPGAPRWAELAAGMLERRSKTGPGRPVFYDMAGRPCAAQASDEADVLYEFHGRRVLGDAAQDALLEEAGARREMPFVAFYDGPAVALPAPQGNGRRGRVLLREAEEGGEAGTREQVRFVLAVCGETERGRVELQSGAPCFTPLCKAPFSEPRAGEGGEDCA